MKSLQTKLLLFLGVLVLITGSALGIIIYVGSKQLVVKSIGTQAKVVANHALKQIDTEEFSTVVKATFEDPDNESSQKKILTMTEYQHLREQLNSLKNTNGLKFLYTLAKDDKGTTRYIVDGFPLNDNENVSMPGSKEDVGYLGIKKAFQTGSSYIGDLTKDQYGPTVSAYVPIKNGDTVIGVIGADFDAAEIYKQLEHAKWVVFLIVGAVLLIVMVGSFFFARFLLNPLKTLTTTVQKVERGDLTTRIVVKSKDEVGQLSRSFAAMVAQLNTMIKTIRESGDNVASLSNELSKGVKVAVESNEEIASTMQSASEEAKITVQKTEESTQSIAIVVEEIEQVAKFTALVAETSTKTLSFAEEGNSSLEKAVEQINLLSGSVRHFSEVMNTLSQRTQDITKDVAVITSITNQTRIIALNAAIEAARAGEYGKGFAVVADTIKKLASQSAESAESIIETIKDIQEFTHRSVETLTEVIQEVETGSDVISQTSEAFTLIKKSSETVADQVQEITAATEQILAKSQQVLADVDQMNQIAQDSSLQYQSVEAHTEEQAHSMQDIATSTDFLTQLARELREQISKFKV